MKTLLILLFVFKSAIISPVLADELSDIYKELGILKRDFRKRVSELDSEEFGAENRKAAKASAAVKRAMKELPALAPQRKVCDAAEAAYLKEVEAIALAGREPTLKELARVKAARLVWLNTQRTLERDATKLDEVRNLKSASTAQHKKVESLVYRLVAESGDEGKALVERIKVLEARYSELKK